MNFKSKKILLLTMTLVFLISFTSCNDKKNINETYQEPSVDQQTEENLSDEQQISNDQENKSITPSEAFSQKGIWFNTYSNTSVSKESQILGILNFDGNGNVTYYKCKDLTFSNLKGLSDNEILELAIKNNKSRIEENIKKGIEINEKERPSFVESKKSFEQHLEFSKNNNDKKGVKTFTDLISNVDKSIAKIDSKIAKFKNYKYSDPTPQKYTLKIKTDGTGNNTHTESIDFTITNDFSDDKRDEMLNVPLEVLDKKEVTFDLYPSSDNYEVYDMHFSGFSSLVKKVEKNEMNFDLDTPDTKGIVVD
ncbi:hypothetical protein [Finegoldia magna]|uniref:hypothetical protein n=1 Tax=Finegoldia magna TaxID=1260 RepID=UPI0026ECF42B|nr:hypothetical protein [Finegoldia magna]